MSAPKLRTRRPTGAVPWPLILIEGGEKSGKSWTCAEFTADNRLGQAYWLDLGEGAADEYAAIPGAAYLVLEHDGTYPSILEQIQAVHAEAKRANAAGEKPVVLIIDSMTNEWDQLKDWTTERARESRRGRRELAADPNAEIKPPPNLWNDANARHYRIMNLLMQFPGIVVMTARGKEVAVMGADGQPVAGQKESKPEGHKNLGFDASAWVRLSRDEAPKVVGVRSVHAGIRPGVDKARTAPNFTLAWLVFDILRCDPATAQVRDLRTLDSTPEHVAEPEPDHQDLPSVADRARAAVARSTGSAPDPAAVEQFTADLRAQITAADTVEQLQALWKSAGALPETMCAAVRAEAEQAVKVLRGHESGRASEPEIDAA
ncbi:hypothetical protein IU433_14265 [Nocardia puris]|uniref:hypothetical protein n=1 Tax=Nocardia puris TaxID=208602 RepID=UPI0018963924|nr:hypothetical protein [Nocardia puris]MBF6460202.1 hypothetical protein [Nocardia puris]